MSHRAMAWKCSKGRVPLKKLGVELSSITHPFVWRETGYRAFWHYSPICTIYSFHMSCRAMAWQCNKGRVPLRDSVSSFLALLTHLYDVPFPYVPQGYGLTMQQGARTLKKLGIELSGISSAIHLSLLPDGQLIGESRCAWEWVTSRTWEWYMCRTWEWVMSRTYGCVTANVWMSHVAHGNESRLAHGNVSRRTWEWAMSRTYGCVMAHVWMSHVLHMGMSHVAHMGMGHVSHIWMRHGLRVNESRRAWEWVTSHMGMSHVSHIQMRHGSRVNESCLSHTGAYGCEWHED